MALPDRFNNNRGLDPRAMATLAAKKNSRDKRDADLKRKNIEREIISLKARLTVIDREIQRLTVSERRYRGDEVKAEQDLQRESQELLELTKELGRHSDKTRQLQELLSAKKFSVGKKVKNDFGRELAQKENDRLKIELRRVDQEIEQLNGRRRRLVSEMSSVQQKMQKAQEMEARQQNQESQGQKEIDKIMEEIKNEENILNRFKTRFALEQKQVSQQESGLKKLQERFKGTASGIPALQSEKNQIQKKIQDLEKDLN